LQVRLKGGELGCESTCRASEEEVLTIAGGEVKALPDGKVAGYLITFSDETSPDLSGDFFTPETDFGSHKTSPTLYNHGVDVKIGDRVIGEAQIKTDDVGVWVEAQLSLRDMYEKAIYKLAQLGKLGWSSGTASHRVKREKIGKANKILSWPLGLDASLTPTPAEPRNLAISLKSIKVTNLESEAGEATQETETENKSTKDTTMAAEEKKEAKKEEQAVSTDAFGRALENVMEETRRQNEIKALEEKKQREMEESLKELAVEFMKSAPAVNGGSASTRISIDPKKNEKKAFMHYLVTGDMGPYIKTAVALNTADAEQGGVLVPDDFYSTIIEKRDEVSIARSAGATVIQTSLSTVDVPIEGDGIDDFAEESGETAVTENENEPFDNEQITVKDYTLLIKVSDNLLSDQKANLEQMLANSFGRRMGEKENAVFVVKAVTGSGKGADAPSLSAVSAGNVNTLYYSLAKEYRDGAVWTMQSSTEAAIAALQGNPFLFTEQTQGTTGSIGVDLLKRRPVFNTGSIDAIGSAKKSILFGNWQYLMIAERQGLQIRRLTELYAGSRQTGFLATFRVGAVVTQAEAFKHLLHPTNT